MSQKCFLYKFFVTILKAPPLIDVNCAVQVDLGLKYGISFAELCHEETKKTLKHKDMQDMAVWYW